MSVEVPTIYYWPITGLAAAPRLALLATVGPDGYKDVFVESYDDFVKRASCPECPMLNLPYIEFPGGKAPVAQSNAVLRAIGRRYNLVGQTPEEQDALDEILEQMTDFVGEYHKMTYYCAKEEFDSYRKTFISKSVPYYIGGVEKMMKFRNGKFVAGGDAPTIADFRVFTLVDAIAKLMEVERRMVVAEFDHLVPWVQAMEELPYVKTYLERYGKLPKNGYLGHWGAE